MSKPVDNLVYTATYQNIEVKIFRFSHGPYYMTMYNLDLPIDKQTIGRFTATFSITELRSTFNKFIKDLLFLRDNIPEMIGEYSLKYGIINFGLSTLQCKFQIHNKITSGNIIVGDGSHLFCNITAIDDMIVKITQINTYIAWEYLKESEDKSR